MKVLILAAGRFDEALERQIVAGREPRLDVFELRAATSLARLYHRQARTTLARKVLAPVYRRFTEGFKAPDVVAAKALLDSLR